jgi:hypothetical protein
MLLLCRLFCSAAGGWWPGPDADAADVWLVPVAARCPLVGRINLLLFVVAALQVAGVLDLLLIPV